MNLHWLGVCVCVCGHLSQISHHVFDFIQAQETHSADGLREHVQNSPTLSHATADKYNRK